MKALWITLGLMIAVPVAVGSFMDAGERQARNVAMDQCVDRGLESNREINRTLYGGRGLTDDQISNVVERCHNRVNHGDLQP